MNNTDYLICKHCDNQFLPHKDKRKNPEFCCKECRLNWEKKHPEKRNARIRAYRKKRYQEDSCWRDVGPVAKQLKQWMIELKSQPCTDCGNCFDVCCMDFDHKVDSGKEYNIAHMFAHHYGRELIEKELKKCELVCANCHRIRTRDRKIGKWKKEI
jgi:hypothetical protein